MRVLCIGMVALLVGCSGAEKADEGAGSGQGNGAPNDAGPDAEVVALGSTVAAVSVGPVTVPTPITFGHVFVDGDLPAGVSLALRTASGAVIPTQLDRKATHPSGALRHGLVSAVLPAGAEGRLELVRVAAPTAPAPHDVKALFDKGFDAVVTVNVGGRTLTASAKTALAQPTRWIDGPVATEWNGRAALADGTGEYPHLLVRFDVRAFEGVEGERVDVTVENIFAFEANRSNVTYDVDISVRGKSLYTKKALAHHTRARWHRVLTPFADVPVGFDRAYFERTRAVPTYDPTVKVDEATLTAWGNAAEPAVEPMEVRFLEKYMPTTGGRPDIGVLPAWSAGWLISMDPRARRAMLAVAESAAAYPGHYRDQSTDRVASLETYDDLTIYGNPGDTKHPFATCAGDCSSPFTFDTAHQPSVSYLPYLITGDRFHLEELQLWAGFDVFSSNPAYRDYGKGLLHSDQVRGFAWSLRTIVHAAFITPDDDPLRSYFEKIVRNNLAWYVDDQINGARKNPLAILNVGYAMAYDGGLGFAPWQDDFFTSAVNVVAGLGFSEADAVLAHKGKGVVGRMVDACWIDAAAYALRARATPTGPFFATYTEARAATFAGVKLNDGTLYLDMPCATQQMADFRTKYDQESGTPRAPWAADEMTGYATADSGFPSNMQPALAAAVDGNVPGAKEAWTKFAARSVKPTYAQGPQFAIVPR